MSNIALIVEDDPSARLIYRHVLVSLGFEVLEACNGSDALYLLETTTPTLAIIDLLLPVLSGETLLSYIDTAPHLQALQVIVISAHPDLMKRVCPYQQFTLLQKPVLPRQIREIARRQPAL